jgi:hypothetical protein
MSRIDFWAIPVLLKRTGWFFWSISLLFNLVPFCQKKNPGRVKNVQYYQNRALVNGIEW